MRTPGGLYVYELSLSQLKDDKMGCGICRVDDLV